ncbi:MAG: MFS transporter [Thermoplasmata archaeon]|nr:MFS transporter [Thermoplasmata archaeon]
MARSVYAFNWYNVGAVLPLVGSALGATTPQLGIVLGSFLAGAGLFQLPAGFAALRWGNRAVAIAALVIMGVFCLASAFSPNWVVLALLRFGAGAGAACFFAPALGLVASYYPVGSRGPVVGLYNAGFSLGSGVGLFAGAFLGAALGWGWALAIGGLALLGFALLAPVVLPKSESLPAHRSLRELWQASRPVLVSRDLWALSLSFMGLWTSFYVAAQYFVQYAHTVHPAWSLALAAGLPTLMIAVEVVGGPLGGWLAERRGDMRVLLGGFGAAAGIAVLLIPFSSLEELVGLFAVLGFLDGATFAVLYLLPTYLPETRGEGLSLGLGLLNAIQIFAGSALAIAFAYVATYAGYTEAWVLAGAFGLATLPLLWFVTGHRYVPPDPVTNASGPAVPPMGRAT